MASFVICPLCRQPLFPEPKRWTCASGHSFDIAREGYVNLLPVQHKHSREPGDRPDMVMARRAFLEAGHYAALRAAAVALLAASSARSLVDIGCGEGYYTSAFATVAAEVVGLDIAKPAIQLAAKRFHALEGLSWIVGSGAILPIADASIDVITSLFTPLHITEMQRVLTQRGQVLIATPAADHLQSVREGLFDEVRAHEPDKFISGFEPAFELVARQEVRVPLALTQETLKQLLLMTPYVWKARVEKRLALQANEAVITEAAFVLMLFRARA